MSLVVPMLLLVVACGPIGDEDEEATATSIPAAAQPTPLVPVPASPVVTAAAATPIGTPPATPMGSPVASPVAIDSSGGAPLASPVATPAGTPEAATVSLPIARNCAPPAPLPIPEDEGPLVITEDAVNLRDGPGTTCEVIEQLTSGDEVVPLSGAVVADELSWILVNADGTEGWVATDFLAPTT